MGIDTGSHSGAQAFPDLGFDNTRYDIIEAVGRGAMGQVYKAYDRNLKRHVALKFLTEDDPSEVSRVLREAQAMAQVEHEHVCKLYEVGEFAGRHYLSIQFIEGLTLDEASARLTLEQKVMVMRDVALAAQEAHKNGIIHRDLKPSNVMVEFKDDGLIKTWVMDFGVARHVSAEKTLDSNVFSGTPLYMAPEQLRSHTQLDRRADIYSMGATLYELICGRPPLLGSSSVQVIFRVMHDDPLPLRKRAPDVPRDLETITMKCLSKDIALRYDSAKALAEDLQHFLNGDPIKAHSPSLFYRATKLVSKNKLLSAVVSIALLAIVITGFWAIRERTNAAYRVYLAQEFSRQAQDIENRMHLIFTMPRHDVSQALNDVQIGIQEIEQQIVKLGPQAKGPGHYAIGRALLTISDFHTSLKHLQMAEAAGYDSAEFHAALCQALSEVYQLEEDKAQHLSLGPDFQAQRIQELKDMYLEPAQHHLERARETTENLYVSALIAQLQDRNEAAKKHARTFTELHPWRAEGYVMEARILSEEAIDIEDGGDYEQALIRHNEAIDRIEEALPFVESHPLIYQCRDSVKQRRFEMLVEHVSGNDEDVFNDLMDSINTTLTVTPNDFRTYIIMAWSLQEWAHHQRDHGQDALEPANQSVEAGRHALRLGVNNPDALKSLSLALKFRAYVLEQNGQDPIPDIEQAIAYMEQALELAPKDVSGLNAMGTILDTYGLFLTKTGQAPMDIVRRSIHFFERAIEINPDFAFAHNNISMPYVDLSYLLMNQGLDPLESLHKAREHLKIAVGLNPNYYNAYYNLSWSYFIEGYYLTTVGQNPIPRLEQAVDAAKKSQTINPENVRAYNVLASTNALIAEHIVNVGKDPSPYLDEARASYFVVLDLMPSSHGAYNDLANTYLIQGRYLLERGLDPSVSLEKALGFLDKSSALNAPSFLSHVNRGYAYRDLAIYQYWTGNDAVDLVRKSSEAFKTGLDANTSYNNAFVGRAWLFNTILDMQLNTCAIDKHALGAAQSDVDQAINLNPKDANAHRQASVLAILKARAQLCVQSTVDGFLFEDALKHAQLAVEHRPNYAEHLRGQAEITRWVLELKPLTKDERDVLWQAAMNSLNQARNATEYETRCDLEEARLLALMPIDETNRSRLNKLIESVIDDGGVFALQAKALRNKLTDSQATKPGGS